MHDLYTHSGILTPFLSDLFYNCLISEVCTREENGNVLVRIADEGPGIPDDQKPHVFDLFYSGNNLTGDSRRGLGLGLALCQSIMKAHGGTIAVHDNTPHGAVFELAFPKAEVSLDE